jgi:hypothetical protein
VLKTAAACPGFPSATVSEFAAPAELIVFTAAILQRCRADGPEKGGDKFFKTE